IHCAVNFVSGENGSAGSARYYALQTPPVRNSAAHVIDHLLEVVSHRQLINPWPLYVPAEAEQPRAAVFGRAQVREPLRSTQNNVRKARQGFSIVNNRWPAPEPDHSREGRPNSRNAALAFERFHQR